MGIKMISFPVWDFFIVLLLLDQYLINSLPFSSEHSLIIHSKSIFDIVNHSSVRKCVKLINALVSIGDNSMFLLDSRKLITSNARIHPSDDKAWFQQNRFNLMNKQRGSRFYFQFGYSEL